MPGRWALLLCWPVAWAQVCSDPQAPPPIVPPPKRLELRPYALQCRVDPRPGLAFDNADFADGNGPRGAKDAAACCAVCAATEGCRFWSFNVDPALPEDPGKCSWSRLSYCCFLHKDGSGNVTLAVDEPSRKQFGAKGRWTSGSISPELGVGPLKRELELSEEATGIAAEEALRPLARQLSEEMYTVGGLRLPLREGAAGPGDIVLKKEGKAPQGALDKDAERYELKVDGKGAVITCRSYRGCAWGVASLVQSLCVSGVPVPTVVLPAMLVQDYPDVAYRGIMVDTARRRVEVEELFDAAFLAHWYKVPYLQLHMTDDHAWTFPSEAFPELGSKNLGFRGPAPVVYKKEELQALVSYADSLGVAVIPELEGPGHSAAMRRSQPAFQGEGGTQPGEGGCINAADEAVYKAMKTLVQEMAAIFTTAPFLHVGCDETATPASLPGFEAFAKAHGIKDASDLFAYYVKFMAEAVKATGKKAMLWGPGALGRLQPGDALLFSWQGSKEDAAAAVKQGLFVVNAPNGGGNSSQEFQRSLYDFGEPTAAPGSQTLPATDLVLGTQVNVWECGWQYAQARRPGGQGESFLDEAVARASGPGWWAASYPRDARDFLGNYSFADRNRLPLRPRCRTTSCAAAPALELRV